MPASNPGSQNTNQRPKAKATPKAKPVKVAPPDTGDPTRANPVQETGKVRMYAHPQRPAAQKVFRQQAQDEAKAAKHAKRLERTVAKIKVTPVPSPDATDSLRSPAQQAHDKQFTAKVVADQRVKAVRAQERGAGTRAVKAFLKSNAHDAKQGATSDINGHQGSGAFAVLAAHAPLNGLNPKFLVNAFKDAGELAVTTPSSVAKLASTAYHNPEKVPGLLAKPYADFAKHPLKMAEDKPVSTALMLAPAGRMPGRIAGRVARKTGAQTLARPTAKLAGTALEEARTGSRDAAVRRVQSRHDVRNPNPEVTAKEVQTRVDEHFDASKHVAHRTVGEAVKSARKATKGQPKHVREAAVDAARTQAQEDARAAGDVRFAKEFGANVRLSHGVAVREALHKVRRQAVGRLDTAKTTAKQAEAAHSAAWQGLRAARQAARSSPLVRTLEFRRRDAQRDLADAQRASTAARLAHSEAVGRAQVLSRNVSGRSTPRPGGVWSAGGHGVRLAKAQVDATAKTVQDVRARIRDLDRQIADEHARPLPPLHPARQAFTNAIQARGQARVALATAKADAHAAAHAHIAAKQAMTNANLIDPAKEGRLFAHKADAATVVKKLNQTAVASGAAEPITFVLHQVGQDRWAAVPKVARQRLYGSGGRGDMGHYNVGTGKATGAKVMRVSRGAFTKAVLPLSFKRLAGDTAEAGIRALVTGAGPMDWLRMGQVVKKMNAHHPGSGDEFASRVTGGKYGLTGPARDFAHGKSLADEFEGTPLEKPGRYATAAGNTPGVKQVRHGWKLYTHAVLGSINHVIEGNARRAMAGQAIKDLGFQDEHLSGMFDKAIEDAANKLHGTHNQVAVGRLVNRMYGKYTGFSPEVRSLLMHWTPFLPWYLNTAHFLFKMLPVDHPVKAALLADVSAAEEDWRKEQGLDPWEPGHAPDFLLGTYPTKSGGHLPIGRYTPWGVGADPAGAASSLLLPQVTGPILNGFGVDWKGDPLTHGGSHGKKFNTGEKALRATVTALEEQVPGVTQAGALTGITPKYVNKDTVVPSAGAYLKKQLPWTPIAPSSASSGGGASSSSGRVKIPGASGGRIRIPGASGGRVKIP